MVIKNAFLFLIFWGLSLLSVAQPWFKRFDSVPVTISGNTLKHPWAGGLNFCQFSHIDLNQDGIKDLFIFDRCSPAYNKISTFINKGTANVPDYVYAPQYRDNFPALHDWALLRDYNCDGKEDIFTYSSGGMAIYKNSSDAGGLKFTLVTSLLYSNFKPNMVNLYVSSVDIPTIADIDNDGDLDVVTFEIGGSKMEFHKNLSKDLFGTCDSLKFELETGCWGKFVEDPLNCKVSLNVSNCFVAPPLPDKRTTDGGHAGSCSFCLDMDADGDKEVILGDLSCNNLTKLTNGGSLSSALMTAQDSAFPSKDTSTLALNMVIFPCGYYLDVDNDNISDLVVSPNAANVSHNFTSVWFYKNKGLENKPVFELVQKDFLQREMIETGEGAYPAFFDENGDGLQDLVIGNHGYYASGNYQSKFSLYRNTGTSTSPTFDLVTRDYAGLAAYNLLSLAPSFGDLDGDGDLDMLIGDYDGKLHYFPNTAGAGNTAGWGTIQPNYMGIDVGNYATPQIIDLDRDGKKDLLIGGRNGKLNYYRNTGTITVPSFSLMTTSLGGVNVTKTGFITGYSYPFLTDIGGSYKLLVGSETGWIYFYDNIDGNLTGTFNRVDSMYQNIWDGPRSAINGTDLDNDGLQDLALGNYGGGVAYYKGMGTNSIKTTERSENFFSFFPNPAGDYAELVFKNELSKDEKNISLSDISGKTIHTSVSRHERIRIDLSSYAPGIYFIKVQITGSGIAGWKRVVVVR